MRKKNVVIAKFPYLKKTGGQLWPISAIICRSHKTDNWPESNTDHKFFETDKEQLCSYWDWQRINEEVKTPFPSICQTFSHRITQFKIQMSYIF